MRKKESAPHPAGSLRAFSSVHDSRRAPRPGVIVPPKDRNMLYAMICHIFFLSMLFYDFLRDKFSTL
jgi:hypothetical protein